MNIQKITLLGVTLLAMLTGPILSMAQNYPGSSYPDQSSSQYPARQGNYYSQYYRPETMLLPPAKTTNSPVEMLEHSIKKVLDFLARHKNVSL